MSVRVGVVEMSDLSKQQTCFVVTPIGAPSTPVNDHANEVLELIIDPVLAELTELNFAPAVRADRMGQPGVVTHQIIDLIWNAELVIADLSFNNPNVFYELALRHGVRKPFVQIGLAGSNLPFDVAGLRTILFDRNRWGDIEKTKAELKAQIRNVMSGKDIVTPLTHYFNTEALSKHGEMGKAMAGIIQAVDDLNGQMSAVMSTLNTVRNASVSNVLTLQMGAQGPQGPQGAQTFNVPPAIPPWNRVRGQAVRSAQDFSQHVLNRELTPEELEEILLPIRKMYQAGHLVGMNEIEVAISGAIINNFRGRQNPSTANNG